MPPRAPWLSTFQSHLSKSSTSEFNVTTVALDAKGQTVPRTRTCGFRGWFPNPELHSSALKALESQNERPNPPVYESEMISFTTDARMEKIGQLEASGNVVEAVFWLKDVGNQWRVRGEAFVIGDPSGGEQEQKAREEIRKGLRVCDGCEGKEKEWSWERQVTTYFANHTPVLRGSFKNPPPGTPRSQVPTNSELKLGQKLNDLHDPVARGNFRVVVILANEVERLDLSDYEKPQRWNWTLVGGTSDDARWEETELWP
ncbi:hypothetical protein KXW98_004116 [Aspergillus fumigatus]|uniref:Pyridoxamine 5'-phosphate oxidase Alr4036 family FMN-binding domain-containing protein n=2 Tax=Aspergillus fumigatus TaxID=746128 RepID=B0Y0U4_ASPFC|nr:conserved hypothetical protein [Aspergillus fumigatus A1163]KAF4260356.1 hypothetical protein CNMCM8057_002261 [Aspergillus fumigatus]KAF4288676.1 hypothetical protein CNMCM8689_002864 [Aspergillus fumigatus]KAF4292788.1 hypothetical protein CNMCM8686_007009 [Aspergillus fumigatus]KAH1271316.1 hypothetical protein KXX30_005841 [Aspergillus fumigatus]